jgi:catechol 2,3-dioxygenase-like lactoylglutathione lyase family enzyme
VPDTYLHCDPTLDSFKETLPVLISPAVPIIRIFSEDKAKEFYMGFLGFNLEWEHRFEANFPIYAQVRRSDLKLHLSEHHGDATPGSAIFVPIENIEALHLELISKNYPYARPDIQDLPWGRVMEVTDPFGNRIRFCEASDK